MAISSLDGINGAASVPDSPPPLATRPLSPGLWLLLGGDGVCVGRVERTRYEAFGTPLPGGKLPKYEEGYRVTSPSGRVVWSATAETVLPPADAAPPGYRAVARRCDWRAVDGGGYSADVTVEYEAEAAAVPKVEPDSLPGRLVSAPGATLEVRTSPLSPAQQQAIGDGLRYGEAAAWMPPNRVKVVCDNGQVNYVMPAGAWDGVINARVPDPPEPKAAYTLPPRRRWLPWAVVAVSWAAAAGAAAVAAWGVGWWIL